MLIFFNAPTTPNHPPQTNKNKNKTPRALQTFLFQQLHTESTVKSPLKKKMYNRPRNLLWQKNENAATLINLIHGLNHKNKNHEESADKCDKEIFKGKKKKPLKPGLLLKERSTRTDMSTLSSDRSRTFLLAPFVLLLLNFFFCEFPPSPLNLPLTQPCGLEAHAPIYIYLQLCKNNIKKTEEKENPSHIRFFKQI